MTKAFVADYRARMAAEPDAEAQFAYVQYLIEAARTIADPLDSAKAQRRLRDALLAEAVKRLKKLAQGTLTATGAGGAVQPIRPYGEAQFLLATCYGNGSLGLTVDHEKAYRLYVQASKQNHAAATYRTAVCSEVGAGTRKDAARAILFYRKACALGDTAGMYKMGMILLQGLLGQAKDPRDGVVWLRRAAEQADKAHPYAVHALAQLYEKKTALNGTAGEIVQDHAMARALYLQGARLGYAPSQTRIAAALEHGSLAGPRDLHAARRWYVLAARQGEPAAELALSGWSLTGVTERGDELWPQNDAEALSYALKAAARSYPKAEYAAGYYYEVGIGVTVSLDEAKKWYNRAAARGDKRAAERLTEIKSGKRVAGRKEAEKECIVM